MWGDLNTMKFGWVKHAFSYGWNDLFAQKNRISTGIMLCQVFFLATVSFVLVTVNESFVQQISGAIKDPASHPVIVMPARTDSNVFLDKFELLKSLQKTNVPGTGKAVYTQDEIVKNGWQLGGPAHQGAFGEVNFDCGIDNSNSIMKMEGIFSIIALDTNSPEVQRFLSNNQLKALDSEEILLSKELIDRGELPRELRAGDSFKCLKAPSFRIAEIIESKNLNNYQAIMSLKYFDKVIGTHSYGRVLIYPNDIEEIPQIEDAVRRLGLQTGNQRSAVVSALKTTRFINQVSFCFIVMLTIIVVFSVWLSFFLRLAHKKKEIGYLRAYGMSNLMLNSIYCLEGLMLSFIGISFAVAALYSMSGFIQRVINLVLNGLSKSSDKGLELIFSPCQAASYILKVSVMISVSFMIATTLSIWWLNRRHPAELLKD